MNADIILTEIEKITIMARREYTVTEVNNYIKNLIASDYVLSNILVKGEVSNCKYHSAGHIYFTLKDEKSSVSCVMFRGKTVHGIDFRMEDGQEVVVAGSFGLYEVAGSIQIYAEKIIPITKPIPPHIANRITVTIRQHTVIQP